jgi:response regulator RpfG family c-di-GMP phosphodiesterase
MASSLTEPLELLVLRPATEESSLQSTLEEMGYQVYSFSLAKEAQVYLEKKEPAIIIAIENTPHDEEAFLLREQLLAHPLQNRIPFLLICKEENVEQRLRGIQLNISHFLQKPLDLETLKVQLKSILSLKAQYERHQEKEKLQAIKKLSATMNHEIKNHLATILGNVDLLFMKYPEMNPDMENRLEKIRKAGKSIKDVLDNLNKLSRITTTLYVSKVEMLKLDSEAKESEQS